MASVDTEELNTGLSGPPAGLIALIERFDPEVIDLPSGSARIRLAADGEGEWDAVVYAWAGRCGCPVGSDNALSARRTAGRTLAAIADGLNADGISTAQGGRQWWPSSVRAALCST